MSNYSNGYAVAIVVNGLVAEVRPDNVVVVPFGADYSIRLINRNPKRALARVYIDNQNVTGGGLILCPTGDREGKDVVHLERPIDKAVTFRFASTDSNAADAHGKGGEDTDGTKGLIKVEWYPERDIYPYGTGYLGAYSKPANDYLPRNVGGQSSSLHRASPPRLGGMERKGLTPESQGFYKCSSGPDPTKTCSLDHSEAMGAIDSGERFVPTSGGITMPESSTLSKSGLSSNTLQSGVTVEGGYSAQSFRYAHIDADYSKQTVILLKLKGYVAEEGIPRQGTRYCPVCRTKTMKDTDKYCRHCGERL